MQLILVAFVDELRFLKFLIQILAASDRAVAKSESGSVQKFAPI
jgi:hypothetical protein